MVGYRIAAFSSSSNLVANFVAEAESPAVADRQDFRKAGGIETLDEFRYGTFGLQFFGTLVYLFRAFSHN